MDRYQNSQYTGFTLLNLLVTLTLVSLLITSGIPGLSRLIANYQVESAYQQLFTLIQFTRMQSVNYNSQVLLCPSNNNRECVNDWNENLMIFVDNNNDEIRNNDELLLQLRQANTDYDYTIHWRASGSQRYLRYKPNGTTANQNGRLTLCLRKGEALYARQIIMYRTGRARRASEEEAQERC